MIFRDDDLSHLTELKEFQKVHEVFAWYGAVHTVAVICKNLEKNVELIDYLKSQSNIDLQVHAWEHLDYSENEEVCLEHLKLCIEKMEQVFGKRPTIWYPTFNKVNEKVIEYAKFLGLEASYQKSGLLRYVQRKGAISEEVLNFHYWAYEDLMFLEPALRIAQERK